MDAKKILVLFGSPHKNGYTAQILDYILKSFADCNITTINAYERNIHPCIDCKACAKTEGCIYNDMQDIDELFKTCDILIIASPVYNNSFPAPLKAIFDRTQRYYHAKHSLKIDPPILKTKSCLLVLTHGKKSFAYEKDVRNQIKPMLNLLGVVQIGHINVSNTDSKDFDMNKFLSKSRNKIQNTIDNL